MRKRACSFKSQHALNFMIQLTALKLFQGFQYCPVGLPGVVNIPHRAFHGAESGSIPVGGTTGTPAFAGVFVFGSIK